MELKEKLREIQLKIEESEMILVGIGNELNTEEITEPNQKEKTIENDKTSYKIDYKEFYRRCQSVYEKLYEKEKKNKSLQNLADMLQGKNYFVISTNADECLYQSGFKKGYVVTPCGRETLFQCSENCSDLVWENKIYLQELFQEQKKEKQIFLKEEPEKFMPKCPHCGKSADFNIMHKERRKLYCEKGYLENWERYMKWLSGTLNKKLLLLDLGTDFLYPQLIRWAFERTALLNQKSYLIRIHKSLFHIPEELKERAEFIAVNSKEFLEF